MIKNIFDYKDKDKFYLKKAYQYYYVDDLSRETNYIEAAKYFKKAADLENAEAQYMYFLICLEEDCIEEGIEEGLVYLKKAAANNYSEAQVTLGHSYFNGKYTERDYDKAVELFKKAREDDNSEAYNCLGFAYMHGKGVEKKDNNEAYECFLKAHELGDCVGTYFLADCYFKGIGVEKDNDEALKYYVESYRKGYHYDYTNFKECLKEIFLPVKNCLENEKVFSEEAFCNLSKIDEYRGILQVFFDELEAEEQM